MSVSRATQFAFGFGLGLCLTLVARTFYLMAEAPLLVAEGVTAQRILYYALTVLLGTAALGAFAYAVIVVIEGVRDKFSDS
jgi:hypothetical protein